MEEAERIPIDITSEQVGEAAAGNPRITENADGSTRIDILRIPCDQIEAKADEIVVCGELDDETIAAILTSENPQALQLKLSDHADATIIGRSEASPMGGISQETTVRVRLEF